MSGSSYMGGLQSRGWFGRTGLGIIVQKPKES
jgi:hypothetical protein